MVVLSIAGLRTMVGVQQSISEYVRVVRAGRRAEVFSKGVVIIHFIMMNDKAVEETWNKFILSFSFFGQAGYWSGDRQH